MGRRGAPQLRRARHAPPTAPALVPRAGAARIPRAVRRVPAAPRGAARGRAHPAGPASDGRADGPERPRALQAAPRGVRPAHPGCAAGPRHPDLPRHPRRGGRADAVAWTPAHARLTLARAASGRAASAARVPRGALRVVPQGGLTRCAVAAPAPSRALAASQRRSSRTGAAKVPSMLLFVFPPDALERLFPAAPQVVRALIHVLQVAHGGAFLEHRGHSPQLVALLDQLGGPGDFRGRAQQRVRGLPQHAGSAGRIAAPLGIQACSRACAARSSSSSLRTSGSTRGPSAGAKVTGSRISRCTTWPASVIASAVTTNVATSTGAAADPASTTNSASNARGSRAYTSPSSRRSPSPAISRGYEWWTAASRAAGAGVTSTLAFCATRPSSPSISSSKIPIAWSTSSM